MKKDDRYNSITTLEVEISSFTGGGYKVRYALTPEKLELMQNNLPDTGMLEWMEGYNKGELAKYGLPTANPSSWRICVNFEDGSDLVSSRTKNFPKNWTKLKELIEATTEMCFRLR